VKVTVPVGVPGPGDVTVAVNVIACPYMDGFGDEASVVVVEFKFIVSVSTAEVLDRKFVSPP
jgi:hypothetical protein